MTLRISFRLLFGACVASAAFFALTLSVQAAACPVTDGGGGDGDSTVDGTLTINGDTTWTPADGTAWDCTGVDILVTNTSTLTIDGDTTNGYAGQINTDSLQVDSGSFISADEKGCTADGSANGYGPNDGGGNVCTVTDAGYGDGQSGSVGSGGGGHGGAGGAGTDKTASATYDSPTAPVLFGSSGGDATNSQGGAGGGVVYINATGTVTVNGGLTADGAAGAINSTNRAAGGGSGGSVYVTTATIAGSGTFTATGGAGGDNTSDDGGGGGGGRIAITYTTSTFSFDDTDFDVNGGSGPGDADDGAKGTVYLEDTDSNIVNIFHGFDYDDTDYSETTWTIDSSATNQYCVTGAATPSVTATNLTFDGTLDCDASVTSFNWSGSTSFAIGSGASMTYADELADIDFTIPTGTQTWTNFTFTGPEEGDFTISDAADLVLVNSTMNANVSWTGLASLNIDSDSSILADTKGCNTSGGTANGHGPNDDGSNVCTISDTGHGIGQSSNVGAGGGGNGGAGGAGTEKEASDVFGLPAAPVHYGPSGGNSTSAASGGTGGGIIRLDATGNLTLNGVLSADGGAGSTNSTNRAGGGGAGGSIYLSVGADFAGSGSFTATGGAGGDNDTVDGGGGGGGRVAITYATTSFSIDNTDFTVTGGTGPDSAADGDKGSVYVKDTTTSAVTIYHGFEYEETDHSVTTWIMDDSATNQYCEAGVASPSITATTLTLGGTIACESTSLTSFNFAGSGAFSVSASTSITTTNEAANMDWDVPASATLSLSGVTVSMANEGDFTIDDAIDLTLASGTSITANTVFTNLTSFTGDSGTTISASEKGCNNTGTVNGFGPNDAGGNVCTVSDSGYGDGASSNVGSGGAGHGGAGGAGTDKTASATYGSSTAPVLYGSSGGSAAAASGGTGGGMVRIGATTITHNGAITADGGSGAINSTTRAAGGGSGGSVYLAATCNFAGSTGTISADGGDGGDNDSDDGGGGGGGIVSISYGNDASSIASGFTASGVAAGGAGPGAAEDGGDGLLNTSDDAGPCLASASTGDSDNDGKIDQVVVTTNEDVAGGTIAGADFTVTGYTVASASRTATSQVTIVLTEAGAVDSDAAPATSIGGSIDDGSANSSTSGSVTPTDGAAPVLLSVSPAELSQTEDGTPTIVLTFSEPMATSFESGTEYAISPALGGLSAAFSSGDEVVTISHNDFDCGTDYNITTTEAEIDAAAGTSTNLNTSGPEDGDWTFSSQDCAGSSSVPSAPRTFGVGDSVSGSNSNGNNTAGTVGDSAVVEPPSQTVASGSVYPVTWENTGTVRTAHVNIYVSYDGGETYTLEAGAVKNDGAYDLDMPDGYFGDVRVKVALTDLAVEVASGQVARFRLGEPPASNGTDTDMRSFSQPETFTSPVTGVEEAVEQVQPGAYITSPSFDTVYLITEDGQRRPFMDAQTFFTYEDGFENVIEVSDATLPTLELGGPVLPQAGVVLVKVESDPRVYTVEEGGVLRWIQTEETASELYGVDWSDYVIDVPATMFPRFEFGEAVEEASEVSANILIMKPRFRLTAKGGK